MLEPPDSKPVQVHRGFQRVDSTSERKVAEELKEQNCNRGWRRDRQGGVCVAGARTNTEFKTPQVYLVASDLKAKKKKNYCKINSSTYSTNNLSSIYYIPGNGPNTGHVNRTELSLGE